MFGFQDVYDRAVPLLLPGGLTIRLPQPAGYAALKMRACIDRSAFYGHDKDANDLALAAFWYQNSPEIEDRLYDPNDAVELLESLNYETDLAAAKLLSLDVAAQLSPEHLNDLRARWSALDLDAVARYFTLPPGAERLASLEIRRSVLEQLAP